MDENEMMTDVIENAAEVADALAPEPVKGIAKPVIYLLGVATCVAATFVVKPICRKVKGVFVKKPDEEFEEDDAEITEKAEEKKEISVAAKGTVIEANTVLLPGEMR